MMNFVHDACVAFSGPPESVSVSFWTPKIVIVSEGSSDQMMSVGFFCPPETCLASLIEQMGKMTVYSIGDNPVDPSHNS